jgi:hypothetical protein
MVIEKINTQLVGLPPNWLSRATAHGGSMVRANEIKKMLGEPIPQIVDEDQIPKEVKEYFGPKGLLERLRKKLSLFSKKKGGKFIPARGTIASVDEDDNLYVGVDFLENYGEDEELVAGILAHEWGHMLSDLPKDMDWSHLNWDQLHEMRRDEEADADAFAGRAMFLMGVSPEPMVKFLTKLDRTKKEKKIPSHKYHNLATRVEILREAFKAEREAMETAKRLFFDKKKNPTGPKIGRVLGQG